MIHEFNLKTEKCLREKVCFQLYASELLAVVIQQSEKARIKLSERADGMDLLLRVSLLLRVRYNVPLKAISAYKKKDPSSSDEREYMENIFNAVCAALIHPPNRLVDKRKGRVRERPLQGQIRRWRRTSAHEPYVEREEGVKTECSQGERV